MCPTTCSWDDNCITASWQWHTTKNQKSYSFTFAVYCNAFKVLYFPFEITSFNFINGQRDEFFERRCIYMIKPSAIFSYLWKILGFQKWNFFGKICLKKLSSTTHPPPLPVPIFFRPTCNFHLHLALVQRQKSQNLCWFWWDIELCFHNLLHHHYHHKPRLLNMDPGNQSVKQSFHLFCLRNMYIPQYKGIEAASMNSLH